MHRSVFEYIALAKLLAVVIAIGFFLINPLAAIIAFLGFMAIKYLLLELFHRFLMPLAILATVLVIPIYVLVHSIGSVGHVNGTPFLIGGAAVLAVLAGIGTGRAFLDHNRDTRVGGNPDTEYAPKPDALEPAIIPPGVTEEIPTAQAPAPAEASPPRAHPREGEFPQDAAVETKGVAQTNRHREPQRHVTSPSHSPARKFVAHHPEGKRNNMTLDSHSHQAKRAIIEMELNRRLPGDNDAAVAKRVPCDRKTVQAHRVRIGFEYKEES